tara:strand:- start:1501 stop:2310 length:810 start_codon:yes stop_codon:yes gene_type:complete
MRNLRLAVGLTVSLTMAGCATNAYRTENPSCDPPSSQPKYGREGHQDTTYLVALMAGHDAHDAALLSFYNQAADDVWLRFSAPPVTFWGSVTHWGYRHRIIAVLHSLHGGDVASVAERRERLSRLIADADQGDTDYYWTGGFLIHALGDSFAHTRPDGQAYGELYGHAFAGHTPDIIGERPELYITYAETLYEALDTGEGDRAELEAYTRHIRALAGSDNSRYERAVRDYRDSLATTPVYDCDVLAERLTMRDVDGFLRDLQASLEARP